ncbi:nucleotidyltransferase domain-containing protein [Methanobrevibacter filiformis]|uniref:nucleotidyltransferase domain-containing protein n=1 Tax=Methanobrevibacter filiformis TaxID=55758 RepID=UPI000A03323D
MIYIIKNRLNSDKTNRKQIAIDFPNPLNHTEIEKIILFGSVARGEDNGELDIDILIITKKRMMILRLKEIFIIKFLIFSWIWVREFPLK